MAHIQITKQIIKWNTHEMTVIHRNTIHFFLHKVVPRFRWFTKLGLYFVYAKFITFEILLCGNNININNGCK